MTYHLITHINCFQVDSLLAIGQFFVLGVLTLPLYALGVQMGSTHRHHLLPATVGSELLAWSKRVGCCCLGGFVLSLMVLYETMMMVVLVCQ